MAEEEKRLSRVHHPRNSRACDVAFRSDARAIQCSIDRCGGRRPADERADLVETKYACHNETTIKESAPRDLDTTKELDARPDRRTCSPHRSAVR
jgi:hypothetical protein